MYKEALEDIKDLTTNYDGFKSVEGLKSLIDDIRSIAVKALKGEKWYEDLAHCICEPYYARQGIHSDACPFYNQGGTTNNA